MTDAARTIALSATWPTTPERSAVLYGGLAALGLTLALATALVGWIALAACVIPMMMVGYSAAASSRATAAPRREADRMADAVRRLEAEAAGLRQKVLVSTGQAVLGAGDRGRAAEREHLTVLHGFVQALRTAAEVVEKP